MEQLGSIKQAINDYKIGGGGCELLVTWVRGGGGELLGVISLSVFM